MTGNEVSAVSFAESIERHALRRFLIATNDEELSKLSNCAPAMIVDKAVLRLSREGLSSALSRTILVAVLVEKDDVSHAFKWAANVRDQLLNPESADLYLLIAFKSGTPNIDQLLKYESNDLFCRKFILRSGETIDELIDRTFLSNINSDSYTEEISDPLHAALIETAKEHQWLSKENMVVWQEAFLSGKSSNELIELIISNLIKTEKDDSPE